MSLRKIYYSLSPKMRLIARKIAFAPFVFIPRQRYSNGLKTPPANLIFTGSGDFKETGERFNAYFKVHDLREEDHVLDVGSGLGRMALPMTTYLKGNYEGLDIMKEGILWCQKNISAKHPNFTFHLLNARNDLYTSTGKNPVDVTFPISSHSKNYCILISVFTHMLPKEVEHYLREVSRCLKKGGTCFATFFIYSDDKELTHNNFQDFQKRDENHALMNPRVKGANVAYNWDYLRKVVFDAGFKLKHISVGKWRSQEGQEDFQDFVVLEKI